MQQLTIAPSDLLAGNRGGTRIFLNMYSNATNLSVSGISVVGSCWKKGKKMMDVSCFACAQSCESVDDTENWRLMVKQRIPTTTSKHSKTILQFDQPLNVPRGTTCGLFLECPNQETMICTAEVPPQITDNQLMIQCMSSTNLVLSPSGFVKATPGKAPIGHVEYFTAWDFIRVMWMGQRDQCHGLSKLSPHVMCYILHLASMTDGTSHGARPSWILTSEACRRLQAGDDSLECVTPQLRLLWPHLSKAEKEAHLDHKRSAQERHCKRVLKTSSAFLERARTPSEARYTRALGHGPT